jgi:hypothetical protein
MYLITLAWGHYLQCGTFIPTQAGFSVAHVEKLRCVLGKSLIMCKVILPTQSDQLGRVVSAKLFMKKKIAVKFETKWFTKKIDGIILGDVTRPSVYLNPRYTKALCNSLTVFTCYVLPSPSSLEIKFHGSEYDRIDNIIYGYSAYNPVQTYIY